MVNLHTSQTKSILATVAVSTVTLLSSISSSFNPASAATIVGTIDNAQDFQSLSVPTGVNSATETIFLTGPNIAVDRTVDLTNSTNAGLGVEFVTNPCTTAPAGGNIGPCLSYSAASGVVGNFSIGYTFPGTDLTTDGADALTLITNFADFGTNLEIIAMNDTGWAKLNTKTPGGIPGDPFGQELDFAYDSFTTSGGFDFTSVDDLLFKFDAFIPSTDLEIKLVGLKDTDSPDSIPEPTGVIGLTIAGILALKTTKRKKQEK